MLYAKGGVRSVYFRPVNQNLSDSAAWRGILYTNATPARCHGGSSCFRLLHRRHRRCAEHRDSIDPPCERGAVHGRMRASPSRWRPPTARSHGTPTGATSGSIGDELRGLYGPSPSRPPHPRAAPTVTIAAATTAGRLGQRSRRDSLEWMTGKSSPEQFGGPLHSYGSPTTADRGGHGRPPCDAVLALQRTAIPAASGDAGHPGPRSAASGAERCWHRTAI